MPTGGILIIGNEILSGKVADSNSTYLCRELRALGVDVERIVTIPDDVDTIAEEVRKMSEAYDFVFTSGGSDPPTTTSPSTASPRPSGAPSR